MGHLSGYIGETQAWFSQNSQSNWRLTGQVQIKVCCSRDHASWLLLTLPVRDGVYQEGSGGCNFIDKKNLWPGEFNQFS